MENKRVLIVLAVVLAISCVIVAATLFSVKWNIGHIPGKSIDDLVELLENDNIYIDRGIISAKRERGMVYVFDSDGYNNTVAVLLTGSRVKNTFVIPDGEMIVLENGDTVKFGRSFTFAYQKPGADTFQPNIVELRQYASPCTEDSVPETAAAVREFLEKGSSEFDSRKMKISMSIDGIWEQDGRYYLLCSRNIDGVGITGNLVLCTVENDIVTSAYGTWCFFTSGSSYSAQLTDILNILFNVKKDLRVSDSGDDGDNAGSITVQGIEHCYSLYFMENEESFCLIPCWQIVTDMDVELIYNAIDGTLYTKNKG